VHNSPCPLLAKEGVRCEDAGMRVPLPTVLSNQFTPPIFFSLNHPLMNLRQKKEGTRSMVAKPICSILPFMPPLP
jgi:hypothetical protein